MKTVKILILVLMAMGTEVRAELSLRDQLKNCENKALTYTNRDGDVVDPGCFDVVKATAQKWASVRSSDGSIEVYGSGGLLYQQNNDPDIGIRFNAGRGQNASVKEIQALALNATDQEVYAYDAFLGKLFTFHLNFFGDCRPTRVVHLPELKGAAGIGYLPNHSEVVLTKPAQAELVFISKVADDLSIFPEHEPKVSGNLKGPRTHLEKPLALTWDSKRGQLLVLDQTQSGGVIRAYSGSGRGDVPPIRERGIPGSTQAPVSIRYESVTDRISVVREDGSTLSLDAVF